MSYVVIARRYRPQQFADIAGQEHITRTLSNSIANGRIGQAYIFAGPRGVGKTTAARILAMALNHEDGPTPTPDINSPICQAIIQGKSMDVMEIDGASNRRIEEIRNLRENINYAPSEGRYRVYIIDEVHMLTNEAFNALLKTLEEPPSHAVFIFATTEIHRVPATILSRCQRFDFKRIPLNTIINHLKTICTSEKIEIDDDALLQIAKKADGSMRDSQSILDQIISFSGQKITIKEVEESIGVINQEIFFDISDKIKDQNLKEILLVSRKLFTSGIDLTELMLGLEEHFRNMLVAVSMESVELLDVADTFSEKYKQQINSYNENDLVAYLNIISQTLADMKWAQQPYLKFELALVKMAKMSASKSIEQILEKVDMLKKKALNKTETPVVETSVPAEPQLQLSTIKEKWPAIVQKVHLIKPIVASILEKFELKKFEGSHLGIKLECNEFQQDIVNKNNTLIVETLEEEFQQQMKLDIGFAVEKTEPGKAPENLSKQKKEKLEKLEMLKAKDPLFKQFVDEFGLEPE
ncbi:MAG: DNA polymerase III subunit gamma/tau [Calditrichaeota bacterium]|nr:MAG: DNA polymerase III subunit gamma/tau [Calditrichota bacterium]MBL1207754.1 DNA polymerase III subunit gamma/tau [Calditrichota bacterium]NOG47588.1 DNA polymerase III subunit gamma/tau [Calditrichota bacterium]